MIERLVEKFLFTSRWLLAPFFIALVLSLLALLVKTVQQVVEFATHFVAATESQAILETLSIVDLTLTGSLIVLVIFSGYENFVSKIDTSRHEDWPDWMSKIDFTGLKLKLMSSIVAISAIQVLRNFMDMAEMSDRDLTWSVVIHLAFVVSALLLALTDRISGEKHVPEQEADPDATTPRGPTVPRVGYLATSTWRQAGGSCAMVMGGFGLAFGFSLGCSTSSLNHQASEASQPSPGGTGSCA